MTRPRLSADALPLVAALLCALGLALVRVMPCEHTARVLTEVPR